MNTYNVEWQAYKGQITFDEEKRELANNFYLGTSPWVDVIEIKLDGNKLWVIFDDFSKLHMKLVEDPIII